MKVVLDTNVLVSALLTPMGAPSAALKIIIGYGEICYDLRLLTEYRKVLNRKEFGFDKEKVKDILDFIKDNGLQIVEVIALSETKFNDPDDKPFLEVALAARADFLITGNKKHFPPSLAGKTEIVSPRDFLKKFQD
jgi:putative PIN family toxin of toxin-antitoxin system